MWPDYTSVAIFFLNLYLLIHSKKSSSKGLFGCDLHDKHFIGLDYLRFDWLVENASFTGPQICI